MIGAARSVLRDPPAELGEDHRHHPSLVALSLESLEGQQRIALFKEACMLQGLIGVVSNPPT